MTTKLIHNAETGEIQEVELTTAEIKAAEENAKLQQMINSKMAYEQKCFKVIPSGSWGQNVYKK